MKCEANTKQKSSTWFRTQVLTGTEKSVTFLSFQNEITELHNNCTFWISTFDWKFHNFCCKGSWLDKPAEYWACIKTKVFLGIRVFLDAEIKIKSIWTQPIDKTCNQSEVHRTLIYYPGSSCAWSKNFRKLSQTFLFLGFPNFSSDFLSLPQPFPVHFPNLTIVFYTFLYSHQSYGKLNAKNWISIKPKSRKFRKVDWERLRKA